MNIDDFDVADIIVRVVSALIILVVTALIARLVKKLLSTQLAKVSALKKHDDGGQSLAESLGTVAALVVWLFGIVAILNLFALTQVVTPIQDLLNGVLAALPGIIGAGLILFIGFILAKIVRQLVETLLQTAGADSWLAKLSKDQPSGARSASRLTGGEAAASGTVTGGGSAPKLSQIVGQLVFALILIVVSISAFQVLGIEAISDPATQMLSLILEAIPAILAAALLLGIGVVISRLVAPILESTLRGLGVDRSLGDLGVNGSGATSPSAIIARIAQVAIVLFFAIAATRALGFPEITQMLNTILEIGGQILLGGAIIAVGVFISNLVPRFVSGQAGQIVRYAALGLFIAIGLRSMGLADSIVNLAFGAIVVGAALAAALAFGLGGRDAAARELQRLQSSRDEKASAAAATGTSSPASPAGSEGTSTP